MRPIRLFILVCATLHLAAQASENVMDRLGEALTFSAAGKNLRGKISGTLELEAYRVEQPSPGLIFAGGPMLLNPRLSVFLDTRWGEHLYGFAQVRMDRGFDPNADTSRFRWDEYAVCVTPGADKTIVLEIGKFATALGNWAPRHGSWENPFVTAPLPYENVTAISDLAAPLTPADFAPVEPDEKYEYNPIIWGPSYSTGIKAMGTRGAFDYAVELKNTGPASRPDSWSLERTGFETPTLTARLGFRPDLRWNVGLSYSDSPYLLPAARSTLPRGSSVRDFRQHLWAQDFGFAWHHLQIWAEFFQNSFAVPRIGLARTQAGYIEAKFKHSPELYTALRINRQIFSRVGPVSAKWRWGHDLWRLDAATGFRLSPFALLKLQASGERPDDQRTRLNLALQFSLRF